MDLKGKFLVEYWNEEPLDQQEAGKRATRVTAKYKLEGDLSGHAHVDFLLFYTFVHNSDDHGSEARYIGLMRLSGQRDGEAVKISAWDRGTFAKGKAKSELDIFEVTIGNKSQKQGGKGSYESIDSKIEWTISLPKEMPH